MKRPVRTKNAPAAIGPYEQAIIVGNLVFTSGQIPLDTITGELVGRDIETQARQVMKNLEAVLSEAGSSFSHVVKTTIYLTDLGNFTKVNEVYTSFFSEADIRPARSTIGIAALPRGAMVEIEMIAVCEQKVYEV